MARDWRDDRIEQLETKLAERDAIIERLTAQVEALMKRVTQLEEKLAENSGNSSKPPSSDAPNVQRPKKPPTGRKRGAQPGHKRSVRPLVPVERVDEVVTCKPEACAGCGEALRGEDPEPARHQVTELPPIAPTITEYQLHALDCACCGHVTRGSLPPGAPTGAFGPNVIATVALLLGIYRQSRRNAVAIMRDLFGVRMCVGSVINCQKFATAALKRPVERAFEAAKAATIKNMDETGWSLAGAYACLWTLVTPVATVFRIASTRGRVAAKEMLGTVQGILGTDRYAVYDIWPSHQHQFCWAHLKRLFTKFSERPGQVGKVGLALLAEQKQLFEHWHRVRDGSLKRSSLRAYVAKMKGRVDALLVDGVNSGCEKTAATCQNLLLSKHALWTFVYNEGVEPTNNAAERALRHAVILRKLCFGSQSEHGCRFIERIATVYATLKQQERSAHAFLVKACRAKLERRAPPSLLPRSARA